MSDTQSYPPSALFQQNGPINPIVVDEAIRTLMRTLPLGDKSEPRAWAYRRGYCAIQALAALNPRDDIELMLGVQAISAYHAAAAGWRLGMNLNRPHGDSPRHTAAAANAARTFDTMVKAVERRQAKPLAPPPGRPPCREWEKTSPTQFMQGWEARVGEVEGTAASTGPGEPSRAWTAEQVFAVERLREEHRIAKQNQGLDLENTEGILPGGGMIMPENPTENQKAYLIRRLKILWDKEMEENKRKGINKFPATRPLRTGDYVP